MIKKLEVALADKLEASVPSTTPDASEASGVVDAGASKQMIPKPSATRKPGYADILVTLSAAAVMPVYLYGHRVVVLLAVAIATALVTELLCVWLRGLKRIEKGDYSCLVTGMITALLMPATVPWWVVSFSVVFALAIAKHPFGGTGHTIFNPAAAGVAFSALCWPELVLKYPVPHAIDLQSTSTVLYGNSLASVLRVGGTPKVDWIDLLLGKYAGPMGATCMLVVGCCLLYLLFRKKASLPMVFAVFAIIAVFAYFWPRTATGRLSSLIFEFSSGALVFGVTFLANDPCSRPRSKAGQTFYGIVLGLLVVLLRRFGQVELEFVYAILLANVFASSCDRYAAKIGEWWAQLTEVPRRKAAARKRLRERLRQRGDGTHA